MTSTHKQITKAATLCLLALSAIASRTQTQATPQPAKPPVPPLQQAFPVPQPPKPIRPIILLDPAHGGSDPGAHLPNNAVEKDLTLAFAARLRPLLGAAGFTVISTHDADADLTTDQRAGIANHAKATACLVIHATTSGSGIHIISSALPEDATPPRNPIPWDIAQTASVPQSLRLANEIGLAIDRARLPVLLTRASIRPLDNLTCPAVVIELTPLADDSSAPVTDAAYQQRTAEAIAAALTSYRTHNAPPATITGAPR